MDSNLNQLDINSENPSVRLIQQLRIRIGDVKNLKTKNSCFKRNCFCVVKLDKEEIYRTHCSTEKSSHLTFGEDFYFDIPRIFRHLSIYLYQSQKTICNSFHYRALGKVVIPRNKLCQLTTDELWFPLLPIHYKTDVHGMINLNVEWQTIPSSNQLILIVSILKCQEICNSLCDSFVVVKLYDGKDLYTKKTKTIKKAIDPEFLETFQFHIDNYIDSQEKILRNLKLTVSVFKNTYTKLCNLGEVNVPLDKIQNGKDYWFYLHLYDMDLPTTGIDIFSIGSLRLRINYVSNYVLPSHFYNNLCNLLLSSTDVKPITSNLVYILGEFTLNKADVAQPLVKIFLHHKMIIPLIKLLAEDEISKVTDVNTIFRGNSLVSKCIDELMKLVGFHYLQNTIKIIIDRIISERKPCEIDPTKLCSSDYLETNKDNLQEYISLIFEAIISSIERCPNVMIEVFALLKDLANKYFSERREVSFYVISGFVFLRFFAPSILNPRLFELTDLQINPSTNRTFTLISKTIQSIGNLIILRKNNPIFKEVYMVPLYEIFLTEDYIAKTKEFLDSISSLDRSSPKEITQEYSILKECTMYKKSLYNRYIFRPRFKKRCFNLTNLHFSYSKSKNKPPILKLPLSELISVKKLNEDYSNLNTFIVSHAKYNLYVKANNYVQAKEWMDTLNRLIHLNSINSNRLITNGVVCNPTNLPDIGIKIDPYRELEQIFSIFTLNQENIDLLINACENECSNVKLWKDVAKTHSSQFIIEDSRFLKSTLFELKNCMNQLQQVHDHCMLIIQGSEIAPIDVANM